MTFGGWSAFYSVTAQAAATLVGLLFLVTSLSPPQANPNGENVGPRLFTTPTVVALALVLVVSALALAPSSETGSACLLMTAAAAAACVYSTTVGLGLRRLESHTHWSDIWFYGVAPTVIYGALAAAAAGAWWRVPHAAYAVGLVLLTLLALAIRNAWDLVTWLAPRRGLGGGPPNG